MANLASIRGNEILLAHCTAPTKILKAFKINTHFETGKGTAVVGEFDLEGVTVFRFDNTLARIFAAYGNTSDSVYDENACRTQLRVELQKQDILVLRNDPLGNHHLVLPGDRLLKLNILSKILPGK
jgi:hypothetical protein